MDRGSLGWWLDKLALGGAIDAYQQGGQPKVAPEPVVPGGGSGLEVPEMFGGNPDYSGSMEGQPAPPMPMPQPAPPVAAPPPPVPEQASAAPINPVPPMIAAPLAQRRRSLHPFSGGGMAGLDRS